MFKEEEEDTDVGRLTSERSMLTLVDYNNMGLPSAAPPAMQVGKVPHKPS